MKTKSEDLFEGFLATNNLPYEKIKEDTTPKPDSRRGVARSLIRNNSLLLNPSIALFAGHIAFFDRS
jgi:hypothetical protein